MTPHAHSTNEPSKPNRAEQQKELKRLRKAAKQGDLEAIARLGTIYRLGQGVKRDIVTAADYHVIAALDGDAGSAQQLSDYREEIEKAALSGSLVAASCLAKMFDRGLGVERDRAKMFAWLLWGEKRGMIDPERELDYAEELLEMKDFYAMILSDVDRARSQLLFETMVAATPNGECSAAASAL